MSMCAPPSAGPYPGLAVADDTARTWPQLGRDLLAELSAYPGRLVLLTGARTDAVTSLMHRDLGLETVQLGYAVSSLDQPPDETGLQRAIGEATVIADLDLLAWPQLAVDPLSFLRRASRRRPTIAVWPGDISEGRARYSSPGRPDHVDQPLHNAVVLRPVRTRYPDEVPFSIERIA